MGILRHRKKIDELEHKKGALGKQDRNYVSLSKIAKLLNVTMPTLTKSYRAIDDILHLVSSESTIHVQRKTRQDRVMNEKRFKETVLENSHLVTSQMNQRKILVSELKEIYGETLSSFDGRLCRDWEIMRILEDAGVVIRVSANYYGEDYLSKENEQ